MTIIVTQIINMEEGNVYMLLQTQRTAYLEDDSRNVMQKAKS